MMGRVTIGVGDGQQAPLPRVELGLRGHPLNEFQWRRVGTGAHNRSPSSDVLVEDLIDHVIVCEGLDMSDGHLPLVVSHELVQGTHRPA